MKPSTLPTLALAATAAVLMGTSVAGAADPKGDRQPPKLDDKTLVAMKAAIPQTAVAEPQRPRKLLVFWRCEGFFHGSGIAAGNEAIRLMGEKTGAYSADISADYEVFTPANLARYDAVVLNNTTRLKFSPSQQQALLDFVRGGKGLIGVHSASDNFYDWPEGAKMIGGQFDGHPWGGGGTWAVKVDAPDHPVAKPFGGKGFKIKDEIYQFKDPYTRADRQVLLSLDLADPDTAKPRGKRSDGDYAVAWLKREGKGRVFYTGLGHAENVFTIPAVLQFTLNGIQYALGDLPAEDSPKG